MAFDPGLVARLDEQVMEWPEITKKKMFGGYGYLWRGNMACAAWKDFLIVRCGPERYTALLERPHTQVFDLTGKVMKGWLMVAAPGIESDAALIEWLEIGRAFAAQLPPK